MAAKGKFNGQAKAGESSLSAETGKADLSSLADKADDDKVVIVCEKRKGKKVVGLLKEPVAFDADGKATVTAKEARYFLSIPGCALDGAKAEAETNSAEHKASGTETKADSAAGTSAESKSSAKSKK